MTLRQISVSVSEDDLVSVLSCAEDHEASGIRVHTETQKPRRATVEMLAGDKRRQELLDALQGVLSGREDWRISLLPVETTIPLPSDELEQEQKDGDDRPKRIAGLTREEILNSVWNQAEIGRNYLVFVILSAVVAAFGMIASNVAVVIGAMVIAPLLGPILAFSVGVALGEERLMLRAAAATATGIVLAVVLGVLIGLIWPIDADSPELLARAEIGFDGIAIGLASGAAAALSLVTGISSALVGVMVAVALLPPATAIGIFLGAGEPDHALGAILLLSVNIVCVNLAAQAVMLTRGITPRAWFEKRKARRGSLINAMIWFGLLSALGLLIWIRAPAAL
jgi:uncharacterized hydrophobic protein (TIGR00341 family)